MTVHVPVSTVEKPLTTIDYIAVLAECKTLSEVRDYGNRLPRDVVQDERFSKAVRQRCAEINDARRHLQRVA